MRKPLGRHGRSRSSISFRGVVLLAGLSACDSNGSAARNAPASETGLSQAALSASVTALAEAPASVAFEFELEGERFELGLQRTAPPTTPDYQSFRRTRDGALVPLPPPDLGCTYRGTAEVQGASSGGAGFAAMSVCTSATQHSPGDAASGVMRAGGGFWRLTPDAADTDASDGIRHFAERLRRGAGAPEPAIETTLYRLPETPAQRLEFREGTDEETKYIDLVVVNDAARIAQLGGATQATTLQFVDTMNALLDTSGLSPRLRVTLRSQVLFDEDPYTPVRDGNEVNNDSLLNEFLAWGLAEDLPVHDEHLLLSGFDFVGGVVGYAGLSVACTSNANGFIVQAGDASGGFAVLSAVHELGHTLGMNHDDDTQRGCAPDGRFIMAAVGCGNCPGAESAEFSPCSIEQFQAYLAGPDYTGLRCADDVPTGAARSCGDGAVQDGESCDCGSGDCTGIDPCCNGATCQLRADAECSDFNDGCCLNCAVVTAEAGTVVCRPERSVCDIAEVCTGASKACPPDTFEAAGSTCADDRDNAGVCYFGDCRSRATQCEQIAEQQDSPAFDGVTGPLARCGTPCNEVVCTTGQNCLTIGNARVNDGVACDNGQCVDGECVNTIDQCPNDPQKSEPGDCGCNQPDIDSDDDGAADCSDGCPDDSDKQLPGACGCGNPESDGDGDGSADCVDECPSDGQKSEPGDCGCNQPDIDSDDDGAADCVDECPTDPIRRRAGACGCGVVEIDTDFDGSPDCVDRCVTDPTSIAPPCTLADGMDTDGDGDVDVNNRAPSRSSKDGCALPGAPTPGGNRLGHLGWLALAVVPLWRRRGFSRAR